jgi:hypothetical protein
MRGFFNGFILGLLVGAGAMWYFRGQPSNARLDEARDRLVSGATNVEHAARTRLDELGLTPDNIKAELKRTGRVIRKKSEALGQSIANATADARITADIKGKMLADPDLSALSISVNTTGGCVTLAGTTSSVANISKAMVLAYDTEGVTQVISTLSVK